MGKASTPSAVYPYMSPGPTATGNGLWTGSCADKDTRQQKRVMNQQNKSEVICDGKPLKNVWSFIYLGAKFSADGNPITDVKARIAKALSEDCREVACGTSGPRNGSG